MSRSTPWLVFASMCLTLVGLGLGCSDVRLKKVAEPPGSNAQSKGSFCVKEPTEVRSTTKILFVVDKSYSNTEVILPDNEGTLPGTDPGGGKRGGAIDRLVQKNMDKDYFRYGLVVFFYDFAQSYVTDPTTRQEGFTPNPQQMFQATQQLRQVPDASETPFIEALEKSLQIVRSDRTAYPNERSNYVILFLSDGIPTVGQRDQTIYSLVDQIKQAGGSVVFNTAFYGNYGRYTQNAKDRLAEMARRGGGKFIDFNTTPDWSFDEFFEKPTFEPWFLSSFMVYNMAAGYCLDGSIDTDSDSDGMCDKDELTLRSDGFDPQNRFSFGDGYGDYFHWRRFKYRETLPPCTDRTDEDHDLLTACEEAYIKNDQADLSIGKNGDPKQFDTDRDGILDGIETFVFFPRTLAFAMDNQNLKEIFDGEEPAQYQIEQHRNPLIVDRGALSYDSVLRPLQNPTLDCYQHDQQTLTLYPTLPVRPENTLPGLAHAAQENPVLVYYVQRKQRAPREDGVLRWSVQLLENDPIRRDHNRAAGLLKIGDNVFQTYAAPKR